ncbi:MAG: hypothetical protein QXR87_07890, partial [Candidatus Hadarchaeales archaeon]
MGRKYKVVKAEIRHSPVDVRELLIRTVHGFPWRTLIPLVACIGVFCFLLLAPVSPLSISPNPPREFTRQTLYALGSSAEDPAWTIDVINNENLRILSDSTVRMVVTKDGRVGIGTSNPALALDVQGGWLRVGSGSSAIQLETQSGFHRIAFENLNFWDWSYGSMVTFVDGKVGIGTTAPSQTLHVEGRVYIGDNVSIKNTTPDHPLVVGPASGGRHLVINDIAGARWGLATGGYDLSFQNDYGGTWNTKVTFTETGNIGVMGDTIYHGADSRLNLYHNTNADDSRSWIELWGSDNPNRVGELTLAGAYITFRIDNSTSDAGTVRMKLSNDGKLSGMRGIIPPSSICGYTFDKFGGLWPAVCVVDDDKPWANNPGWKDPNQTNWTGPINIAYYPSCYPGEYGPRGVDGAIAIWYFIGKPPASNLIFYVCHVDDTLDVYLKDVTTGNVTTVLNVGSASTQDTTWSVSGLDPNHEYVLFIYFRD